MDKNPSSTLDEVTVFVDTSLDTSLAITVSGNDTIYELKRKLEHEHQLSDREIKIRTLKVHRWGRLFSLSDMMCVQRAAGGGVDECLLFADASIVEKTGEIEHVSHNVGSNVQLIGSGSCGNRLVSRPDRPFNALNERLLSIDDSVPFLLEGNKNDIGDQNGSVDSGREISKDPEMGIKQYDDRCKTSNDSEMGIKHFDEDHRKISSGETINMPEPETHEDGSLYSEGFRVPTAQEHKKDTSRKEISSEPVLLKESEESSQVVMGHPKDSLNNDGGRALAPDFDNKSDSRNHGTNDTNKETEVSGNQTEIRKDISVHCITRAEDASQSHATSKKKRKFESTSDLEDSLKENNVLISDSNKGTSHQDASKSLAAPKKKQRLENVTAEELSKEYKEASQPEIASELAGITASTTLDGSLSETSDMLTKSSINKKNKKKKKAFNPPHQVVDEAPSRSDYIEKRSMVVSAEINNQSLSAEDVAPICRQGLKEDNCAPIQELQEPSFGFNNGAQEKQEGHPPIVDEAPGEKGISSAERVQEKREPTQTIDSEAMLSESQGKTDGSNSKLIVTSKLSNLNELVTPSKKKKKKKKTKDSTGAEDIKDSQCDISLPEPHEAVHSEQDIDKAKNKESNLSHKDGKDKSEKDTESGHLITDAGKHGGMEVETSQQVGKTPENAKSTKKKHKRKHDAMKAEEKSASHGDPALAIDSRTEALGDKGKNRKLSKTIPNDQSNAKCLESGRKYGSQTGTLHAGSNFVSESKLPSQQDHTSVVTLIKPIIPGNHEEVSWEGEEIDFHKYMVPNQSKNEVVASGELHVEEVTKSKGVDNKLKPKKNRKAVDSSGYSHNSQIPLQSHDNQQIGGKSEASRSSSMQLQGSISNADVVVSQPKKTVSKSGTKTQSSDASGKINSIPKVAGKLNLAEGSVANSLTKNKNEAVDLPSSKTKNSNIAAQTQSKPVINHQSGVTQNVAASGKALGDDDGEVLNSSKHKKSSATPVAPKLRNRSSEGNGVVSGASTASSDYSLSSESDHSDGESNAGSCASSGKKDTSRSGYSSIKGKPATRLKNDDIFLNSSVYKKAKRAASQSLLEEDSQAPEFVPDSQPAL